MLIICSFEKFYLCLPPEAQHMPSNTQTYPDFLDFYGTILEQLSVNMCLNYEAQIREHTYTMYRQDIPPSKAVVLLESLISNFKLNKPNE